MSGVGLSHLDDIRRLQSKLESDAPDDDSDDNIMKKYAAVVGKKSDSEEEEDDEEEEMERPRGQFSQGRQPRPGSAMFKEGGNSMRGSGEPKKSLIYNKMDEARSSDDDTSENEMNNLSSSQEEANQIGSKYAGALSNNISNKPKIDSYTTKIRESKSIVDASQRDNEPTPGGLALREKLGLPDPIQASFKKEVYSSMPKREKEIIQSSHDNEEGEEEEDESVEQDDKTKLLAWKKELEEKFKKFDSFKGAKKKEENETKKNVSDFNMVRTSQDYDKISQIKQGNSLVEQDPSDAFLLKTAAFQGLSNGASGFGGYQSITKQSEQRESELSISRPSNSIRIKDEIIANKGKEVTNKKLDSVAMKAALEKNNFFNTNYELSDTQHNETMPPRGHDDPDTINDVIKQPLSSRRERSNPFSNVENTALRQRVSELEEQLSKCKQENESTLKQMIENNQRTVQKARSQYEREIDHLKEQLEEAYIQIKDMQDNRGRPACDHQSKAVQTVEDSLEKNFLKLKELYDTLYRANVALVKDQKELQEKYTKLLKAYNNSNKKVVKDEKKTSSRIKSGESPLIRNQNSGQMYL
jgi:hypothetical protein